MQLNLIWTQPPSTLSEAAWIRWLFGRFKLTEYVDSTFTTMPDESIYVISSNTYPLQRLPDKFVDGLKRVRKKGLLHLSDEWFSGGYDLYSQFDFVFRNYYSTAFAHPGIKVLPLGPAWKPSQPSHVATSITNRKWVWAFAGGTSAARLSMVKAFTDVRPNQCILFDSRRGEKPPLNQDAFISLLSDTIFSPCPMGNVVLETFRLYEALELGCIPILERRRWHRYFGPLMPGNPLPTFRNWRKAADFVKQISREPKELESYRHRVSVWWFNYKKILQNEVTEFTLAGSNGLFSTSLKRNVFLHGGLHQAWRLNELLKHANCTSLRERIRLTVQRRRI
jgi:hypothetical protein